MNPYIIVLIGVGLYGLFLTLLLFMFPRTTLTRGHVPPQMASFTKTRYYDCGCRIEGAVGVPGCDDCTEPGLR